MYMEGRHVYTHDKIGRIRRDIGPFTSTRGLKVVTGHLNTECPYHVVVLAHVSCEPDSDTACKRFVSFFIFFVELFGPLGSVQLRSDAGVSLGGFVAD